MDKQITAMIKELKIDYAQRDAKNIDNLMDILFKNTTDSVVIGTCLSEWCLSNDSIKQLFLNDWAGWDDVLIDENDVSIKNFGKYTWVQINAGLKTIFADTEDYFNDYKNSVKNFANEECSSYEKVSNIQWLLSLALHTRETSTRKYLWDLKIMLILENINDTYICRLMQYSLPLSLSHPDLRIVGDGLCKDVFNKEAATLNEYSANHSSDMELCDELKQHVAKIIESDFDEAHGTGINSMIVKGDASSFYFCCDGLVHNHIDTEKEMTKIIDKIKNDAYEGSTKDQLFKMRRDISFINRAVPNNGDSDVPIRCIGIGSKDSEGLHIQEYDLSLPLYYYLEQKNDEYKSCK